MKYTRSIAAAGVLCGALVAAPMGPVQAQTFLSRFDASPTAFSPDGDGFSDSTIVTFALADTALSVTIVVFAADAVTPVDTLRAPAPSNLLGNQRVSWKGRRWDGTPAGEGTYVLSIDARGKSLPDTTASIPLFIDVTRPFVQIIGVDPAIYAPGLAGAPTVLSAQIVIASSSPAPPGRTPDELGLSILNPNGAPLDYDTSAVAFAPALSGPRGRFVRRDTTYHMTWDASGQTLSDGEYTIRITLIDVATGSVQASHPARVDTRLPAVGVTSPRSNSHHRVLPDSLYGWTYDRSGIDSLRIRYGATRPFTDITPGYVRNDTIFFAAPLADSALVEGTQSITIRAVDQVGWPQNHAFTVTWDQSAPAPPTLDPFVGTWKTDTFHLTGDFEAVSGAEARIRIRRDGVVIDSVFVVLIEDRFEHDVPLHPGRNVFTATLLDGALNESGPSNAVEVTFDATADLYIPAPFRPGDVFTLNLPREADGVEMRLFDMAGDFVARIDDASRRQYYQIAWDGRNAEGAEARKGPLVVVVRVNYPDGARDTMRKIFLLETGP